MAKDKKTPAPAATAPKRRRIKKAVPVPSRTKELRRLIQATTQKVKRMRHDHLILGDDAERKLLRHDISLAIRSVNAFHEELAMLDRSHKYEALR